MDELASDPLFDVDRCAEQLFLYLWTKNRAGSSCPGVRVPDTVWQLFPRAPRSPPLPARARPPPSAPMLLRLPACPRAWQTFLPALASRPAPGPAPGLRAPAAPRVGGAPCRAALTPRPWGGQRRW